MPNWCECELVVRGGPLDLLNFVNTTLKHGLFAGVAPKPDDLVDKDAYGEGELAYEAVFGDRKNAGLLKRFEYLRVADPDSRYDDIYNVSSQDLLELLFPGQSQEMFSVAEDYRRCLDKTGHLNWYSWCMANWGTKWPEQSLFTQEDYLPGTDESWTAYFNTAWSPPLEFLKRASKMYPELTFWLSYHELGDWFAGYQEYRNGLMLTGMSGTPDQLNEEGKPLFPEAYRCLERPPPPDDS